MNYQEAIHYIHSIPKFIRPLGNAHLAGLLQALGNPQEKLKCIHIAGTNGKGSTAAILAEILMNAGYKTGLFTSPFIEVFNERIQINGQNIPDTALADYTETVRKKMEESGCNVSEFAFVTAVAFLYFYHEGCDFVVLETGMGGKLDATNVIKHPLVSVLTSISMDHMQFLGNTLEEITAEKCGIIKPGSAVVTYPNTAVLPIIHAAAAEKNAPLTEALTAHPIHGGFIYKEKNYPLNLSGEYQPQNAAVALETIGVLRTNGIIISDRAVSDGLKNVRWPARFEFLRENLVIDGGHNIDGIRALKQSLAAQNRPILLVMAMMEDKTYAECVREICPIAQYLIATELPMPRCLSAEQLLACSEIPGKAVSDPAAAVREALAMAKKNTLICVCGSLYLAGRIRKLYS